MPAARTHVAVGVVNLAEATEAKDTPHQQTSSKEATMPTSSHLAHVARRLKRQLNGRAFLTIPRLDVTQLLRDVSGEDSTRIKASLAAELEQKLLEQGLRCYPSLADTTTGDTVRLFHAGTLLGTLVDLIAHPSVDDDPDLADVLTKLKGKWKTATDGAALQPASPAR